MTKFREAISIFDMLKIGVGPSSSHTLGPWKASLKFLEKVERLYGIELIKSIDVLLYGSLAKTGVGHGTDIAVMLGLMGEDPVTMDVTQIQPYIQTINQRQQLNLAGKHMIPFNPKDDVQFLVTESLPHHPNALTYLVTFKNGEQMADTYYSIGGGFVVQEGAEEVGDDSISLHFPIENAGDLLHWAMKTGLNISEIVLENELGWRSEEETRAGVLNIWHTMRDCIYRGCHIDGTLPGGLNVRRRAAAMNKRLVAGKPYNNFDEWLRVIKDGGDNFGYILDWVSCFALAVNEENANFSRVVTAPTNGAAGVLPAVLLYFIAFCDGNDEEKIINFLSTASEIGSIFKKGSTISAAMGGCQAEIGVSSSMAAAALTEALGGSPRQAMMAAEIAMEHHLGLTCDPVGGLVQIPCIERNTMGSIKAITAAQLAMRSNPDDAKVSLDAVVKTMWETAQDMNMKYKETADGGLAINIPLGLSEC